MSFQHRRPLSNTRGIRRTGLCSVPQLFCLFNNEITICPMGASVLGRSSAYPSLPLPLLSVSCPSKSHCFSRQTLPLSGPEQCKSFCKVNGNISSPLPKPSTLPWEELSFGMSLFHYNAFNPSTVDVSLSGWDEFVCRCISNSKIYHRFSEVRSPSHPLAFCASNMSSKSTCLVDSA